MNPTKTQIITNDRLEPVNVNGTPLEYVSEYTYRGQQISIHMSNEIEIKRRIGQAWRKFWSLKFILTDNTLKTNLKVEVFEKCVLSVLLYGSQTWSLNKKLQNMIRICQRKIMQVTLKDRIRNEDLRTSTGMKDAVEGHVARMRDTRWT